MVSIKRRRDDIEEEGTPRKLRARIADDETSTEPDAFEAQTPSRRARNQHLTDFGTPRSILKKTGAVNGVNGVNGAHAVTPKSNRKLLFETPTKSANGETPNGTPTIVRNADRSARRKSNRRIFEHAAHGEESDEEAFDEEETLAEEILEEDREAVETVEEVTQEEVPVPETPSKRKRGRPKGSGKKKPKSPTPPTELPPHEEYFWQNRPGGLKTSNNTLSAQSLLNHDEYFQAMSGYMDRHQPEMDFLLELHTRAFDQWIFELEEGFNVCLYGYGSKRAITDKFAAHLYHHLSKMAHNGSKKTTKIAVINGYAAGTTLKELLTTIASIAVTSAIKLPNQPAVLLDFLLDHLSTSPPSHPIPVILNSIDSPYLRKAPVPSMLARLAAHPSINLICTADTPNFPLMWDVGLKTQYKFLFHDATTFAPYDAEIDVVETVNELLGRSGRRVGGRDGVGFVLRSLPENARSLYRILVMEQLALDIMEQGLDDDDDDDDATATPKNKKVAQIKAATSESNQGVEYRVLYHKAVQEFVCSSEVGFRTLLKEFHDHQMIESRKDAMGTERLWVPFRQEELEGLAEDLASDAF